MIENLIIIPYRNRKKHLDFFISNTWPLIEKHVNNPFLLIVEQNEDNKLFNRGKLLNIGGVLYKDKCNYLITQDVDINPYENFLKYYNEYCDKNLIINIFGSAYKTLGGITKIHISDFFEINGFTNNYFGWGCEDRNLYNRAQFFKKNIKHVIFSNDKDISNKVNRFNDVYDKHKNNNFYYITNFEYHAFDKLSEKEKQFYIYDSGLNNLEYKIINDTKLKDNIRHIIVDI